MTVRPLLAALVLLAATSAAADTTTPYPARFSENHRFLLDQNGKPFFYLGDTAWELFHRLDRADTELYLKNRAAKGFTVIQAVVLAEYAGLTEPNSDGDVPLQNNDPTKPVEAYFRHVDDVVNLAEKLGLVVGMLPTWGDKWNKKWGQGPEIFTPENAATFGEFVGKRYQDKPVVWILGGDRPVDNDRHKAIIRAMAAGLKKGDGGRHLLTFHPAGGQSSAAHFHKDDWLDFNMIQSGHAYNTDNGARITADYNRTPAKPVLDGEPGYEDHPSGFNAKNGYLDDYDTRKFAYWALFAGAPGHTYGCHDVWQFYSTARPAVTAARTTWKTALDLPGATQVGLARRLMESRPILSRVPDDSLVVSDRGKCTDLIRATTGDGGHYAMVYSASGRPFSVDLAKLKGERFRACWFDPRTGNAKALESVGRSGPHEFKPPTQGKGQDWVLVLDDESRAYPTPGPAAP